VGGDRRRRASRGRTGSDHIELHSRLTRRGSGRPVRPTVRSV